MSWLFSTSLTLTEIMALSFLFNTAIEVAWLGVSVAEGVGDLGSSAFTSPKPPQKPPQKQPKQQPECLLETRESKSTREERRYRSYFQRYYAIHGRFPVVMYDSSKKIMVSRIKEDIKRAYAEKLQQGATAT